jgi:hypothetical protein
MNHWYYPVQKMPCTSKVELRPSSEQIKLDKSISGQAKNEVSRLHFCFEAG